VGVASAYRSPEHDFDAWQAAFATKYGDTAKQRAKMTDGPLGKEAEDLMVDYAIRNKAAAGFSNHTQGLAIDFKTVQDGKKLSTSHKHDPMWQDSWLYFWLTHNGSRFGFTQLESEMWHWNHAAVVSGGTTDAQTPGADHDEGPAADTTPAPPRPKAPAHQDAAAGPKPDAPKPATGAARPVVEFGPHARADKVAATSLEILRDLLATAGVPHAVISSTARTATDQARAMYQNLVGSHKGQGVAAQHRLYGRGGDAVIDVFVEQQRQGASPGEIREAMRAKIEEIGPSKVSRHCGDPAVLNVFDVAPNSLGGAEHQEAFIAAAQAAVAAGVVSKFIPYPQDPGHHLEIRPHQ
jgi:hypothetical protein